MNRIDLGLLASLDALLTTGSVTQAAQRMHLSTPAMSHALGRIRAMVGDPLLVRAGRHLVPTPRALELAGPVNRLLSEAQALLQPTTADNLAGVRRRFVVRAPEGVPVVFGAGLALAMQESMPLASLQFVSDGQADIDAFRDGRVDLDIGRLHEWPAEAQTVVLSSQRLVGAVRAGHPLSTARPSVKRFAAERHVAITPRKGEVLAVDAALEDAGYTRFVALSVPSAQAALIVASRSALVACVPERAARAMQAGLALALFDLPLPVPEQPMLMAWHPRHNADPAHAWLRQCVQRVAGDPDWLLPPLAPQRRARAKAPS